MLIRIIPSSSANNGTIMGGISSAGMNVRFYDTRACIIDSYACIVNEIILECIHTGFVCYSFLLPSFIVRVDYWNVSSDHL